MEQTVSSSTKTAGNGKVSVVLTSWNRKTDLQKTLKSVFNQTYDDIEVVVVDNNSADGTVQMLREQFPQVKVIVMPDSSYGACETFNIGFANAAGQYVAILDDDVTLPADWVEKLVNKFKIEPESTGLIATKIVDPKGLNWPYPGSEGKEFYCGNFVGCGFMVKTVALKRTRGYAKEYFIFWNEEELAAQLLAKGYNIKYFPEVETNHKAAPCQRLSKRRFYFEVRNRLWTFAMHDSMAKSLKNMLSHLQQNFTYCRRYRYPLVFFQATLDAFMGLPTCLRHRQVVDSPYWDIKG